MPHIPWEDVDWLSVVLTAAVLVAFVVAIVKTWHWPARITRVLDVILGREEDQGVPAIPSMDQRITSLRSDLLAATAAQNAEIAEIKSQVVPNHGSTKKLSEEVQQVQTDLLHLKKGLEALADRFEQHLRK